MSFILLFFPLLLFSQTDSESSHPLIQTEVSTQSEQPDSYIQIVDNILSNIKIQTRDISKDKEEKIISVLKETEEEIKTIKETDRYIKNPIDAITEIRKALISYYIKTNKYPLNLEELVPHFISQIPEIKIHSDYGSSVKYIRTSNYDKDYTKTVDSTTEYIYFSDPQSIYWGFIIINSTDIFKGNFYYKY